MTQPDDLLTLVQEYHHDSPPFDLDAIVAAGKQRQARRRVATGLTAFVGVAAATLAVAILASGSPTNATKVSAPHTRTQHPAPRSSLPTPHRHPRTPPSKPLTAPKVKLVAYTGKQLAGYTVDEIPQGWVLGGVNQFTLTVNPAGYSNTDPADFVGKLVVSLQPNDEFPSHGVHVTVDGQPGVITGLGGTQYGPVMVFNDSAGHTVDIEVPLSLGWTTPGPLIAFAEGIHVTDGARPSFG